MARRFAPASLLLGNFVIGTSVLAPTGMLPQLASGFDVTIREASLLVTFGAVMLCIGTPLLSWLTSPMDRRVLLTSSLFIVALSQLASAFAPSYGSLLALRLLMLAAAAPFTPQAAGVAGLLVPLEQRASTISFVFLGWSIAAAVGIPMIATIAGSLGFQTSYVILSGVALLATALVAWRLPSALRTAPVQLSTWGTLLREPSVLRLLSLTILLTAGQFVVITFFGPLLSKLTQADANTVGLTFAIFGIAGFVGNLLASRIVSRWGAYRTSLAATSAMAVGVSSWALGAGTFPAMAIGVAIWGLGFASTNSMQQARLVASAPLFAGAAVALNSTSLYVGQALGSALGGLLFEQGQLVLMGFASAALIFLALGVLVTTRPRAETRTPASMLATERR